MSSAASSQAGGIRFALPSTHHRPMVTTPSTHQALQLTRLGIRHRHHVGSNPNNSFILSRQPLPLSPSAVSAFTTAAAAVGPFHAAPSTLAKLSLSRQCRVAADGKGSATSCGGNGTTAGMLHGSGLQVWRRPSGRRAGGSAAAAAVTGGGAGSSPLVGLFAVVLGYACLAGSLFRSVPQIAIILRTGSAEGLSLTSNLVELMCFTVTVAYNMQQGYAFNTYGEVFACWIQDVIIVGLIFRHLRLSRSVVAASTAAFAASCAVLFSPMCPLAVLSALQLSTIGVMAVGARLPQIWLNVRRGDAGVLSPLTCLLNVAGCVVRIFTTAVLTRDGIIMGGCITQLVLNAVLLYQSIATPGKHHRLAATHAADATAAATASAIAATTAASTLADTDPPAGGMRGQAAAASAPNDNGINGNSGKTVTTALFTPSAVGLGGASAS